MGTLRKIFTTSVGAALMTEEGLRDYIARQALKGKEEVSKVVAGEIKRFLDHIDIQKALAGLTLHVQASITIGPRDGSREPMKLSIKNLKIRKR